MPVSHKGFISMGLVNIPVALYTATQDEDIRFNQLCPDGGRVKYKKICASTGEEIDNKHIQKGFQYEGDRYVVVTDEEFEKVKTTKDKALQIYQFTDLSSIPPIFYDKSYHAAPEKGGEKAYELLRRILFEENKVAIAKTVLGTKETLLMIMADEEIIFVQTMFFENEVREFPKQFQRPEVTEAELKMGKALINQMDKAFNPADFHDEYQIRLRELIEKKIAGKRIVSAKQAKPDNIINLMDALKASVDSKKTKATAAKKPAAKKTASGKRKGA